MDIEPDRLSGRRTTATIIGVIPSKFLIAGMLAFEALLILHYYHDIWISGALVLGTFWFLLDAIVLWRGDSYSLAQMRIFMLAWNAIALGSMGWVWSTASLAR